MSKKPQSSALHPGVGFRIKKDFPRLKSEFVQKFTEFPTPDISDLMNRLYTMRPEIKNLINQKNILGTACTVKVFPGDNLMVHKALDIAKPGDVIVVDGAGSMHNAIVGDLISTKAKHRQISGFIIDGCIRDISGIKEVEMPVYAIGTTPVGPLHRGPGELNFPISCGGIPVHPGDIVYGDMNGVVVICPEFAEDLLSQLQQKKQKLENYIESVKKGNFSNAWVDDILDENQCLIIDEDIPI